MASPVGSGAIARRYGLGVSPATIRNEMARLEDDGYIIRRYTSGGGIPSDKGYRYYVESLVKEEVPLMEQRMISNLFHQVAHVIGVQLTTPGIPAIYYGTEQAFDGSEACVEFWEYPVEFGSSTSGMSRCS